MTPPKFLKTAIFKDHSCPQKQLSFFKIYLNISHSYSLLSLFIFFLHYFSLALCHNSIWLPSFLTTPFSLSFKFHFFFVSFSKNYLHHFPGVLLSMILQRTLNFHLCTVDSLYFLGNMTSFLSPLCLQPSYIYFWTSCQHLNLYISKHISLSCTIFWFLLSLYLVDDSYHSWSKNFWCLFIFFLFLICFLLLQLPVPFILPGFFEELLTC